MNVAVTGVGRRRVTVHAPLPVEASLQAVMTDPAVAVRWIDAAALKGTEHVDERESVGHV